MLVYDLGRIHVRGDRPANQPRPRRRCSPAAHDSHLGGHNWDLRLADFLAEPSSAKQARDPRVEPQHLERLLQRAVQVKLALGARGHTSLRLDLGGQSEQIAVTPEQFEGMTADLGRADGADLRVGARRRRS